MHTKEYCEIFGRRAVLTERYCLKRASCSWCNATGSLGVGQHMPIIDPIKHVLITTMRERNMTTTSSKCERDKQYYGRQKT